MKFLEFISAVNLFEAAKDRYTQMFSNLVPLHKEAGKAGAIADEAEYEQVANNEIEWAMNTLKKQDKIVWYLRLVKLERLRELALATQHTAQDVVNMSPENSGMDSPQTAVYLKASQAYDKARNQLAKKMGVSGDDASQAAMDATNPRFKRKMEHFMSLGIAALDEYVFAMQTPRQIISDWTPVEDAWKEKRSALLDIDREDVETLIEYPDGSEWVNINKGYCDAEANAMGHCGNAGAKENDTILSYRSIQEVDGKKMWKPHLTFILDTSTGLLGETKGRGNDKPSEKYHSVITDLLRLPIVKGIKGGGYMPENNFKLADLPQEVQEELVEEKPGLADIEYDYNKRGMTKDLLKRMESLWGDTETKFPEYRKSESADKGDFYHDTRYTIDDFIHHYGGDQAEWVAKVLSGDEYLDISYSGAPIDDLWYELSPKIQQQVGEWIIDEHSDFVEEWKEENDQDYDGTDARDTWSIISEYELSDITEALERGRWRGDEIGAESEMYKSLQGWLEELPNERDLPFSLSPGWDGSEGYQELVIPEETMVDIVSNYLDDVAYAGDLDRFPEFRELEAPYNGWQDYDEDAAKEEAVEQLREAGVLA